MAAGSEDLQVVTRLQGRNGEWIITNTRVGAPGAFSEVRVGLDPSGCKVAVKIQDLQDAACKEHSDLELRTLRHLLSQPKHDLSFFVDVLEVIERDEVRFIVMPLYGSDLFHYSERIGRVDMVRARQIFADLCVATHSLHKAGICHLDIKLENILLDPKHQRVILADFGFSQTVDDLQTAYNGSLHYAAPEVVGNKPFMGPAADVWSLGVVLYSMITDAFPVDHADARVIFSQLTQFRPSMVDMGCVPSPIARNILARVFDPNPSTRITLPELLAHPWLADISSVARVPLW